ncbi:MAG: arginine--tRNA ligase [Alphaproteobacteria bacterium]|nr:arginine--tRNA ligase [Alphaproteobacteria bacterium]
MTFHKRLQALVEETVKGLSEREALPGGLDCSRALVEAPRDPDHGDVASNAALVLAKQAKMKPRDIADLIAGELQQHEDVADVEVAGPGFINLRMTPSFWKTQLAEILESGAEFGASDLGGGEKVNVEFVSANPTGPMHVGHARGAVVGDVLASLLEKAGYDVTREFYINDAGAQVAQLARSVYLRYREACGETIGDIPEGLYPGGYLKPVGEMIAARDGEKWLDQDEAAWIETFRDVAVREMMELIKEDLAVLGVRHGVFSSELALQEAGEVERCYQFLLDQDLIYEGVLEPPKGKKPDDWEERPQWLFRSTNFGDDSDRPLKKSDGSWTYFATDIAYHRDKARRGFSNMIDVWGVDHGGYVKRMKAAVAAITEGEGALDVKLTALVNLSDKGEPVKMSKRAGSFVTLRDVVDRVGKGVVRFIMLTRKNDAPLDFDFAKVTEQSRDNPVFYVQYAHARSHSVMRLVKEDMPDIDLSTATLAGGPLHRLTDESELALIKQLASWPRMVESAAEAHEPHRCAFYLYDLAAAFHALWNKGKDDAQLRFIVQDDRELTMARMALVRSVALVVALGLEMFGVEPLEEMR